MGTGREIHVITTWIPRSVPISILVFTLHETIVFRKISITLFSDIRRKTYISSMERFRSINWNLPLENIIDDVFIRDERIQRDSTMYNLINGTLTDPFANIEDDCDEINLEALKQWYGKDISDIEEDKNESEDEITQNEKNYAEKQLKHNINKRPKNKQTKNKQTTVNEKKSYIPGIRKLPLHFPRISKLNSSQHAMCICVLSRLMDHQSVSISAKEKAELEQYMALQKIISAEQSEFLEFVKKIWNNQFPWPVEHNVHIDLKWNKQLFELKKIPRYYVESSNIPFFLDKKITVKFVSCLQEGIFSEIVLPKCDNKPYFFTMESSVLFRKYPPRVSSTLPHFRLPVSEDTQCVSFAEETKVDLVISSSGLKCLLSNISSDYSNSWTVPVIIRSHDGKNIVYIDKKLPPPAATALQKNTGIYKYILRHCLVPTEIESSKEMTSTTEDKPMAEDREKSDGMFSFVKNGETERLEENPSSLMAQNATYKLFTIGPTESQSQCKLIKDLPKEYQILIRTKIDGIEVLPSGQSQPLMLAPKLEHQLVFGAEAATLEEGLQQWGSLVFRPNASLARVRIAAESGEMIQIERHTTMSLSTEMKRLYNVKVEDSLAFLHNVIERLSCLTPGQYVMRHVPQYGPFAYVYKKVEDSTKNNFDLHTVYESKFKTIPVTPWLPIDTMLMTPALQYYQKMPAMFIPRKTFKSSNATPGTSKESFTLKNQNSTEQTVSVPPRRSLRQKKPSTKPNDK